MERADSRVVGLGTLSSGRPRPIEVAIVGGGCAAISSAFELTRPEHRGRYRVTVYQVGWRLGGKGASGRGPADRIEEHGLHVWMGFYENAFRLLRECYAELGRDPNRCRIASWRQAFVPDPVVGVVDRDARGAPRDWLAHFPAAPGEPGDPDTRPDLLSVPGYLVRMAGLLRALLRSCQAEHRPADTAFAHPGDTPRTAPSVEAVGQILSRIFRYGLLATSAGLLEAIRLLEAMLVGVTRYPRSLPLRLLDEIAASARRQIGALAERDDEIRRVWDIADIVLAILRGGLRFGLATDPRGLDGIDDYDWREWLRLNGASETSLDSAFLRGIYALAFAYEGGDVRRPRLSAAVALRGAFRMFLTYRGALFWKMRAGMGDVVFAPFYEVLKRRGVRFEFFHRLENLRLVDPERLEPGERPYVEALDFDVQAEVRGGREYQPLVDVRGLPCWPSEPDWSQLADGERLRREDPDLESFWDRRKVRSRTLRVVEDFDVVVLGVGLGAVPTVCRELVRRDPRWRNLVENVGTVGTQSFQLWLRDGLEGLGWRGPSVSISAFVPPFETWADMPQLVAEESWPTPPGAIAYFCGVLPDPTVPPERSDTAYPRKRREEVRARAVAFLERDVAHFWPRAVPREGEFRWELLLDPTSAQAATGSADAFRFGSQFWRANVDPSDRYVLSLPGTQRYRISPLDNTYDNLTIAGDWTQCGHNAGCVEAAVMSGRLAAHAISQSPALEDIVGFDHP